MNGTTVKGEDVEILRYVCGFLFSISGSEVLLVRKNGPEWQKGHLNGIAGEIGVALSPEGSTLGRFETPLEAMARVFDESVNCLSPDPDHPYETVLTPFTSLDVWRPFTILAGSGWPGNEAGPMWVIHYFFNRTQMITKARSKTDEALEIICPNEIFGKRSVSNLTWLIPLAQNFGRERAKMFTMCEHYTLNSASMMKQMEVIRARGGLK